MTYSWELYGDQVTGTAHTMVFIAYINNKRKH